MFIKWIEIYGFKSFYDKVKIEFNKGISGIVGPNGSGKSNITDAIRWVFGEQSVRFLRASKMDEVIFAGTEKRKPLGFAEVSICLDNSDRMIDIDFQEVVLCRRIYRNGENEYFINKSSCRLKDIQELLFNSGVGKDGFAIISQGKVDEIINARPTERYRIFEEACQVSKYKYRKEEAEKKLKATNENIIRVLDIIEELKKQITDLEPQKDLALEYLEVKKKWEELYENKILFEYNRLLNDYEIINRNQEDYQKKLLEYSKEIEESLKIKNNLDSELGVLKEKKENLINYSSQLKDNIGRLISNIKLFEKEVTLKGQSIAKINSDIEKIKEQLDVEFNYLHDFQRQLNVENEAYHIIEKDANEVKDKLNQKKELLNQIQNNYRQMEIEIIEVLNNIEKNQNNLANTKNLYKSLCNRVNEIENNLLEIIDKSHLLGQNIQKLKDDKQNFENECYKKNLEKKKIIEEIDLINIDIEDIKKSLETVSKENIQVVERLKILTNMEQNLEGYNKSIKEVYRYVNNNKEISFYGTVGSLIKVKKDFIKAVEASLGGNLQNLVVENEDDAKLLIEFARSEKIGRITVIPLSAINNLKKNPNNDFHNVEGFLGYVSEFINIDYKLSNIPYLLAGNILVFDKLENAIKFEKACGYKYRIVTLTGDVINPGGIFSGGEKKADLSILTRKVEIEELKIKNSQLNGEIKSLEKIAFEKEIKKQGLLTVLNSLDNDLSKLQLNINDLEKELQFTIYKKEQLIEKREELTKEKEFTSVQIEAINNEILKIQSFIEDLKSKKVNLDNQLNEYKQEINRLESEMANLQTCFEELNKKKNNCQMNIGILNQKIINIQQQIENQKATIEELTNQRDEFSESIEKIMINLDNLKKEYQELIIEKKNTEKELEMVCNEFSKVEERYIENEKKISDNRYNIELLEHQIRDIEIQQIEIENKINVIQEKYYDKFKKNIDIINMEVEWDESKEQKLKLLENKLYEYGEINIHVIDEVNRLQDRISFLSRQIDDLNKTKDDLENLIDQLEKNINTIFSHNLSIIREKFKEIFVQLFGGGTCDLILINDNGKDEVGIEIEARPPGKKTNNLNLLSGGEKALTAIALLFSFLLFKGSSFCVLDEIDSSLDEINVKRFAQFINSIYSSDQIIVVTHRKPTMEVCNYLYGVTMEEQGISKVITLNLENIKKG